MGSCLAEAALELGHRVTIVSGPVNIDYPAAAELIRVTTTREMLDATQQCFERADGLIGAAAPCDYMPINVSNQKLSKTGNGLQLSLLETPDIVATLGASKRPGQWVVGFALETEDVRFRAIVKMTKKSCDMIISNSAEAMNSQDNSVEIILHGGRLLEQAQGSKLHVSRRILYQIQSHLITT
jgi:phosphopantothenoylcysteine decarboxylase/phosphopantothenate--cysteine ligase